MRLGILGAIAQTKNTSHFNALIEIFFAFSTTFRAQNFFKDAWNVFDFITVIGSIIDAMVLEIGVCIQVNAQNTLIECDFASVFILNTYFLNDNFRLKRLFFLYSFE